MASGSSLYHPATLVLPDCPKKGHAASSFTIARWWLRQLIYRAYSLKEWQTLSPFYQICQCLLGLSASSISFVSLLGHRLIFCPYFLKVLLGGYSDPCILWAYYYCLLCRSPPFFCLRVSPSLWLCGLCPVLYEYDNRGFLLTNKLYIWSTVQ